MTLLLLMAVALGTGFALIFMGGRRRRRLSLLVGLIGALVVLGIAFAMPDEESVVIGDIAIVVTPVVRAMTVAWSATVAVLGLIELGVGGRPTVVGPSLIGLAAAAMALATRDAASSVAALAAGSVAGVVIPGLHGWLEGPTPSRLATTQRGALADIVFEGPRLARATLLPVEIIGTAPRLAGAKPVAGFSGGSAK